MVIEGQIYISKQNMKMVVTCVSLKFIYVHRRKGGLYRYAKANWKRYNFKLVTSKYYNWQEAIKSKEFLDDDWVEGGDY